MLKKWIWGILAFIVLYVACLFTFPQQMLSIWEKVWLSGINESILGTKNMIDEFVESFDFQGKYDTTKKNAIEIKQNVESWVQTTKDTIEDIQNKADQAQQLLEDTKQSAQETLDNFGKVKDTLDDMIPTNTGSDTN